MESAENKMPWDCLDLTFRAENISSEGKEISLKLTEEQKESLCKSLDLIDITTFKGNCLIKPSGKDRFSVTGSVSFGIKQTCVISLEPVASEYSKEIEARFWPEEAVARYFASRLEIETDPLDEDEPEQIEAGIINFSRYLYEFFATSINPYPRKEGVEFEWPEGRDAGIGEDPLSNKPFAALKILQKSGKHREE